MCEKEMNDHEVLHSLSQKSSKTDTYQQTALNLGMQFSIPNYLKVNYKLHLLPP